MGEGQEYNPLPEVIASACPFDKVLQPDGFEMQVPFPGLSALKERFEGETELVPDDEDSFKSVPLHAFGNQRVYLVGLVGTSGRPQVVVKIDNRFPHMPVAELLK